MMHMNSDYLFGHKFFQSAIDLSVMAKDRATVRLNETPDYAEARRLYECAIRDAEAGIAECEANPEQFPEGGAVQHMKEQVSSWKGEIYSMP